MTPGRFPDDPLIFSAPGAPPDIMTGHRFDPAAYCLAITMLSRLRPVALVFLLAAASPPALSEPASPPAASYRLPYPEGQSYLCTQSRNGGSTHKGSVIHAVDFSMLEGTTVCAVRGGRVVAVKSDGYAGGASPAFTVHANYIHIDHGDGTLGRYMHLKKDGVFVKVGDVVHQGDPIGLSGNTGFSTGPHLHFDVWKGGVTIPFAFEEVETDGGLPRVGESYLSRNTPGIPPSLRDDLARTLRTAEFFHRFGAYHYAYPLYQRIASQALAADYEPQAVARERIREMQERAEKLAGKAAPAEGEEGAALEELALARAAYNGVPGARKIGQRYAELARRAGAPAALDALGDRLKAQDLFFTGLRHEADGRPEAAGRSYRQILEAYPATPHAAQARPRLRDLEGPGAGS